MNNHGKLERKIATYSRRRIRKETSEANDYGGLLEANYSR